MSANLALDVIEEAINGALGDLDVIVNDCTAVAEAVVAAVRAMTPQEQAELIGGEVEFWSFFDSGEPYSHIKPFTDIPTGRVMPPEQIAKNLIRGGTTVKVKAAGPYREVQP